MTAPDYNHVTNDALRVAVAEQMGWTVDDPDTGNFMAGCDANGKCGVIPNYPESLDAIHEAIHAQPNEMQWLIFVDLAHIVSADIPAALGSAREYCLAYLSVVAPEKLKP